MLPVHPMLDAALRVGLAFLLALPLGWVRERRPRSAGLRSYPLVSVCVCGFLLLGQLEAGGAKTQADVFYGVLNGIGFVGAGAIMKTEGHATGLNAAVSLWFAGAIGASAAFGYVLLSTALAVLSALALWVPSLWNRERGTS